MAVSQTTPLEPTPIDRLVGPFRAFARHELAGASLLIAATVVALVWANSPWKDVYHHLLSLPVTVGIGNAVLSKDLLHWINDGLMGFFFFLVGLEIKREVLAGELASLRKAALPIAAAIGGMVVPAGTYLVFNAGGSGEPGWGIPMATDIAFALGVLMMLGSRVPVGLRVFLTALAIADDLGAILVIAIFYTADLSLISLALGLLLIGIAAAMNALGVRNAVAYFIVGTLTWLAFLNSGIHATLAAVLMAFTIPASTRIDGRAFLERVDGLLGSFRSTDVPRAKRLLSTDQQHYLHEVNVAVGQATAPLQVLEHAISPIATFIVLPVFALANAGVTLSGGLGASLASPVGLGIILGLFVGKQVGIVLASLVTVKLGLAELPSRVTWRSLHGAAVLAGIGFTMSLFISGLAFRDPALQEVSKAAILTGSLISGVVGWSLLRFGKPAPALAKVEESATSH